MTDNLFAIIPAGGVGSRALTAGRQMPKQYCMINGVTMLQLAVEALRADARVSAVHIGVAAQDSWIDTLNLGSRVHVHRTAGPTRAHTVSATLQAVLGSEQREQGIRGDGWALVHDAARPGLQSASLTALVDACLEQRRGGLLALPVPDTVKRAVVDEQQQICVAQTIPRDGLWLAQTPQLFPAHDLLDALRTAIEKGLDITDEASAMEAAGFSPLLVRGSAENMKVTWPADFAMMERWLA
ncbi:IspD/TarI family cytidylyltransferase [Advenella mimigardefordensis]|uniref:2-C-methyl-D-erythritol 4-phosphate cytidylyltransferase n=1 Tax=Advenella mimigardefordensis (strain DSM 17166 / LMG 22922 / DPN7) TaxID=1247726 RepID=W0PHU2_ADVMD|nr:2-C-methyl-D-erythritol 4-phosphate cytidylyltransferase [Advenella mimigardefordensis]AHG64513.1 2-C-methyl-D-erythritol 4-phosphate cytidylyltransferase [Advenella mimigardefordensis DPN7]